MRNQQVDFGRLSTIVSEFDIEGKVQSIQAFGSGHINDSYLVTTDASIRYVFQRINHAIFKDVDGLMNNMDAVCRYIVQLDQNREENRKYYIEIIRAGDRKYINDDEGNFWRLMNYIEGSQSFNLAENPEMVQETGRAFGEFALKLDKFPVGTLIETIPDFHNMKWRIANFRKAVEADVKGRVEQTRSEIDFVESLASEMIAMFELIEKGLIPLRVTHNDTKLNNLLFNYQNKAICVVDLDTVMPGSLLFDYGDSIRTTTATAEEDEADLDRVGFNMDYFRAYTRGFLSETKGILTELEKANLVLSSMYMTFIMGVRFLTDYLEGDHYYKINRKSHNLDRCRAQFRMVKLMLEMRKQMNQVIETELEKLKI